MELSTISQPDFTALAVVIFEKEKASLPQEMYTSGIFKVDTMPANQGNTREYTEMSMEEYADNKPEGAQAERARVQQGYKKIMTSKRIAKDVGITYEMRTQNKYPEVIGALTSRPRLAINRRELDLTHRFTFCLSTTYTDKNGETVDIAMGDTFALGYTLHALKASSTTYRNRLAGNPQFSKGSLENMLKMKVENTFNPWGEKVTSMPLDVIWSSEDPNTCNTIAEYLQSTASPDALNSGVVNVYRGKFRHVVLSRLATDAAGGVDSTKAKMWGVASTQGFDAHCGIWEEPRLKAPAPGNNQEDSSTDDWDFGVRAGYGIVILSGVGFGVSDGLGTA